LGERWSDETSEKNLIRGNTLEGKKEDLPTHLMFTQCKAFS